MVIADPDTWRASKARQVLALKDVANFLLDNKVCAVSGLRASAKVPILMLERLAGTRNTSMFNVFHRSSWIFINFEHLNLGRRVKWTLGRGSRAARSTSATGTCCPCSTRGFSGASRPCFLTFFVIFHVFFTFSPLVPMILNAFGVDRELSDQHVDASMGNPSVRHHTQPEESPATAPCEAIRS